MSHSLRAQVGRRPTALLVALLALLFVAPLSLTSCASQPARTAQRAAADVLLPPEQEVELGRQVAEQVEQEFDLHPNDDVQLYVRQLGQRVVEAAGDDVPEGIQFYFRVIDDPETVNAFALPGGWIYVFSGLIQAMESEAELVAVLSHEVAHITRRHVAQRLVAAYGLETLLRVALGEDPGTLQQIVAAIVGQGFMLKYSRDQERDADTFGVRYAVRANYDPHGFITFFEKMFDQPQPPTFLSSHPLPRERVERIEAMIDELSNVPDRRNVDRLQRVKQML